VTARAHGRRLLAFALVPLSALPLLALAPGVASSVEQRLQELRGTPRAEAPAPGPLVDLRCIASPACGSAWTVTPR